MKILLSNDDGIEAEGLKVLAAAIEELGYDLTVAAPHRERSAAGHSITLHKPLRYHEVKPNYYAVTGTPADCIYIATRHLLKKKPDIVVSGINNGENLGDSIYYSGTVAAAREGAIFGIPSIAFSLVTGHSPIKVEKHWDSAKEFIKKFLPNFLDHCISSHYYYNINIPNLPSSQIKGVKIANQGRRFYKDVVTEGVDPRFKKYFWIGGAYEGHDHQPGTDCTLVDQKYISVVPLHLDSTANEAFDKCKSWESL